jgi:hypothetical protein
VQDAQFVFCAGFAVWVRFCRAGVGHGGCDRGLGLGRVWWVEGGRRSNGELVVSFGGKDFENGGPHYQAALALLPAAQLIASAALSSSTVSGWALAGCCCLERRLQ